MSRMILVACFLLAVSKSFTASGELVPVDVSEFYVTPGEAAVLRWSAAETPAPEQLAFCVYDVNAALVSAGVAESDGTQVTAAVTLPQGYWEIAFDATGERFGVISLPAAEKPFDEFFAIDAALSWLVRMDDLREGIMKSAKRSGIGMMRERFALAGVAPEDGKFDWQTPRRYDTLRQAYKKHGIEILEMSHDAPDWMGKRKAYPKDLAKYAGAWKAIAEKWEDTWGAVEVWNEPDIFFGGDLPADQYVALVKALAYRFSRDGMKKPLVGGVVAHHNDDWIAAAGRNNLLELLDIFSFHTYDRATSMERETARYMDLGLPLWLTECGRPWKKRPEEANRPLVEQDLESAADIVMKGVESKCCGIARYFPFVLPYYVEHEDCFGMLDKQGTPLRSMAGYAQMIRLLAHAEYVGDLKPEAFSVIGRPVVRARVFRAADDRMIVVLYTAVMEPTEFAPAFEVLGAESVTGESLPAEKLMITNSMIYLFADVPENFIETDTSAMKLLARAKEYQKREKTWRPSPLVPVYDYDEEVVTPMSAGYRVKDAERYGKMAVTIYNVSDGDATGSFDAATFSLETGQNITIVEDRMAMGMFARGSERPYTQWDVVCEAEGGRWSFVVEFLAESTFEWLLEKHKNHQAAEISPEKWTASSSGEMSVAAAEQGGVILKCVFGDVDKWCYPRLAVPEDVSLKECTGVILRAKAGGETTPRFFLHERDSGAGYMTKSALFPADGRWHAVYIPFDRLIHCGATPADPNGKLDLEDVDAISVGFNTKSAEATLEIGEIYLIMP